MIGVWSPPRLDYVGGAIKRHDLLYTGLKQLKDCSFVDLVKKRTMTLENNNLRWVQRYASELQRCLRRHLKPTSISGGKVLHRKSTIEPLTHYDFAPRA